MQAIQKINNRDINVSNYLRRYKLPAFLLIIVVILAFYGNFLYPYAFYIYSRLAYGGDQKFYGVVIHLPDKWYVKEYLRKDALFIARLPSSNTDKTRFLYLQHFDKKSLNNHIEKQGYLCDKRALAKSPIHYSNNCSDISNIVPSQIWIYPKYGITITAYRYKDNDLKYALEVINNQEL